MTNETATNETRDRFTVDHRPEDSRRPMEPFYRAAWESSRDYGIGMARAGKNRRNG